MYFIYSHFSFNLYRLRESRGMTVSQIADYLGIPREQYRHFESGLEVPAPKVLLEISRLLKIDPDRVKRWIEVGEAKLKTETLTREELKGTDVYLVDFDEATARVAAGYLEQTKRELNQRQKQIIATLKKKLFGMLRLPILPMNYILILQALDSEERRGREYVHDIANFLVDGESLAGFIAREPYLAAYIFYAANEIYFPDEQCVSIIDCCNRLTLEQFENLLLLCVHNNPIYQEPHDLPEIQLDSDFTSLAALFALKLKAYLSPELKEGFENLYQACLLQGIGKYAIYYLMNPSAKIKDPEDIKNGSAVFDGLDQELFDLILYEMHGVAAAVFCSHLKFPDKTRELLLRHHDQPVSQVSPLCAMLKLINLYVDSNFPSWSKKETEETLMAYPQVKLQPDQLFQVSVEMKKSKGNFFEKSSSLLEEARQVADYTTAEIKRMIRPMNAKAKPVRLPKKSEFRYDPGLQSTLLNVAYAYHTKFIYRHFTRRIDEPLEAFGERMKNFMVNLDFLTSVDCEVVAHKNQISEDELLARLFKTK